MALEELDLLDISKETLPQFIVEIIGYILSITCIPIAIHGNFKLYRHMHGREFFKKRESPFALNATFIFAMFVFPLYQIVFIHSSSIVGQCIVTLLYFISWYLLLYFLIVKTWIIYYKCNQAISMEERQWQRMINPVHISRSSRKQSWFIRNGEVYGNITYVRKVVAALFMCGFIIGAAASVLLTVQSSPLSVVIAIIMILFALFTPIIMYTIIVCKTPSYGDIYNIHWESKLHSKLVLLLLIILSVSNAVIKCTRDIDNLVYIWPLQVIVLYTMNHVSTYSICGKYASTSDNDEYLMVGNTKFITLEMILRNKTALHLLAVHLSKEFSLECLLSFIEFNNYQKYCINLMEDEERAEMNDNYDLHKFLMDLPSNVPNSGIIIDIEHPIICRNVMFVAKVKAQKMYQKYVENGCDLEINIPYRQRLKVRALLEDLQYLLAADIRLTDLVMLFNESKSHMIQLLNFSLWRFKQEPTFDCVVEIFEEQ